MDITSVFRTKACISIHKASEDIFVMTDTEEGDVYEINETTKIIWDYLCAGKTPYEILKIIHGFALNSEDIQINDIMNIVSFLCKNHLIEIKKNFRCF